MARLPLALALVTGLVAQGVLGNPYYDPGKPVSDLVRWKWETLNAAPTTTTTQQGSP